MKVESGAFEVPYSASSRFESGSGSNPDELLGAAHAGCFSMALSLMLGQAGYEPESIETTASVSIEPEGDGFAIKRIHLSTKGRVPNIDEATFRKHAENAKVGCPVSQALAAVPEITLDAALR
jgi:osmotically inducible protein OsmC